MATAQQTYAEKVYRAALSLGIPEPQARLAAAQSSLETGYGKAAPGNAYFGIKAGPSWSGPTTNLLTHEEVNGQMVPTTAAFRAYSDPSGSLADWWSTLQAKWPNAASAQTFSDAIAGLQSGVHGAYATDSGYGAKLKSIASASLPAANSALNAINSAAPAGINPSAYAPTPAGPFSAPRLGTSLIPPTPAGLPTMSRSGPATPQPIRLPNGSMVIPGRPYTDSDGSVTTFDAQGNRTHIPPPLFNLNKEANANTILGGLIRNKVPEIASQVSQQVGNTVNSGLNAATAKVAELGSGIGSAFGSLFGGAPRPPLLTPGANAAPAVPPRLTPPAPIPVKAPVATPAIPSPISAYSSGYGAGEYGYTPVSYGASPALPAPAPLVPPPVTLQPLRQVNVAPAPPVGQIKTPSIADIIGNALRSGGYTVTGNNKGFVSSGKGGFSPGALIPTTTMSGGVPNYLKGL